MVIAVRNAGTRTIPNIAVTVCNVTCASQAPPGQGSTAAAFGARLEQAYLANPSRPVWIVLRAPGTCLFGCGGSDTGASATAYNNTWALGPLGPGRTARFDWRVTAVASGTHVVAWQVAAGLNANAKAVLRSGAEPRGVFVVRIRREPPQYYVKPDGDVVTVR
jgi:hypothetical protein